MALLEYYPRQKGAVKRLSLNHTPFRIGRGSACQFVISSTEVSKEHAEIFMEGGQWRIRDLGSTNGTYVNGYRVSEAPISDDDILHVAQEEFRFLATASQSGDYDNPNTVPLCGKAPPSVARSTQYLGELIEKRAVRILFQAIVDLETGLAMGFEALARGMHSDLSASPVDLLNLADRCGMVSTLSELFRHVAVHDAGKLPHAEYLFLNLHPTEIHAETFAEHLREIQTIVPSDRKLVVELHENSACDFATLKRFRQELHDLNFHVAYDDFGAGQARFLELAELPPDFVKLDMKLIRNIDQVEPRRNLLRALARVSRELGIKVIAEGVETPEEAEVCRELGCQFGQGYFFGLPKAATTHMAKRTTEHFNVAELRARLKKKPIAS